MEWKQVSDLPKDDETYLVAWLQADGTYSGYHRAYYVEEEGKFFSCENNNSHPLHVDIYLPIPEIKGDLYD